MSAFKPSNAKYVQNPNGTMQVAVLPNKPIPKNISIMNNKVSFNKLSSPNKMNTYHRLYAISNNVNRADEPDLIYYIMFWYYFNFYDKELSKELVDFRLLYSKFTGILYRNTAEKIPVSVLYRTLNKLNKPSLKRLLKTLET
jgi:hypothetical protein